MQRSTATEYVALGQIAIFQLRGTSDTYVNIAADTRQHVVLLY